VRSPALLFFVVLASFLMSHQPLWAQQVSPESLAVNSVVLTLAEFAEIAASDSGVLAEISRNEGKTILQGESLGHLEDAEAKLAVARAETELKRAQLLAQSDLLLRAAQKSHEVAAADLQRARDSIDRFAKSVSQTELDRLQLLAEKGQLEIEQAKHQMADLELECRLREHDLAAAQLKWDRRKLLAPFPGTIAEWRKQRGEWVAQGAPVARLIRLDRLRAEGFLNAAALPRLSVGLAAEFERATNNDELKASPERYAGTITFLSPEIDPINQQVRFWAEIENPDLQLRPGQSGTLRITLPPPATLQSQSSVSTTPK